MGVADELDWEREDLAGFLLKIYIYIYIGGVCVEDRSPG